MHFEHVERGELLAVAGGALLALAVFLPWFGLGNRFTTLGDARGPDVSLSAWQALTVLRILLLLAALAPFILAYIVMREHALSWPRGELTAVVGLTAFTLVLVRGVILRPGEPSGQVGLEYGWFLALLATALILVGAMLHQAATGPGRARRPPGVL